MESAPAGVSYVPSLEDFRFLNREEDTLMGMAVPDQDNFLGSMNLMNLDSDYVTDI